VEVTGRSDLLQTTIDKGVEWEGLGGEEITGGRGHVTIGARVHVPLRRWRRSEGHGVEGSDKRVLVPDGGKRSRGTVGL
jgi:hypothetical protein